MKKYGTGEVIPEDDDLAKEATKPWTADDAEALRKELQDDEDE